MSTAEALSPDVDARYMCAVPKPRASPTQITKAPHNHDHDHDLNMNMTQRTLVYNALTCQREEEHAQEEGPGARKGVASTLARHRCFRAKAFYKKYVVVWGMLKPLQQTTGFVDF